VARPLLFTGARRHNGGDFNRDSGPPNVRRSVRERGSNVDTPKRLRIDVTDRFPSRAAKKTVNQTELVDPELLLERG
ncbi:MAG TPA: hypothetical protein VFH68_02165, partial [Polyangia bacterium]|nr:hypothetical protein [Polyangia bacterium]